MDRRERSEAEKELEEQGGCTDEKEEKRKKSWRYRERSEAKKDLEEQGGWTDEKEEMRRKSWR